MSVRLTPEPEVVALVKAVKARMEGLALVEAEIKDGVEVFRRGDNAFLHLEIRRDHMNLDLWLPDEQLGEARSSGIARAHPFLGEDAIKVRFERAQDLAKVSRWIESSYTYAPERVLRPPRPSPSMPIEPPSRSNGAEELRSAPPHAAVVDSAPPHVARTSAPDDSNGTEPGAGADPKPAKKARASKPSSSKAGAKAHTKANATAKSAKAKTSSKPKPAARAKARAAKPKSAKRGTAKRAARATSTSRSKKASSASSRKSSARKPKKK